LLDYGEALNNYLEAYTIALKNLDPKSEMIVLNNIAILYSKEEKYDKAEEYFGKAYSIAKENKDSLKTGWYAVNLAIVAKEKNQLEQSANYLKAAFPLLQNQTSIQLQAKLVQADLLLLEKKPDAAEKQALALLPKLNDDIYSDYRIATLLLLSRIYEQKQQTDKAIEYALFSYDKNMNLENKIALYKRLAYLYRQTNQTEQAFNYFDSVDSAKDSLTRTKNGMLFENSRIKFELQNYQNELSESTKKLNTERKTFIIIFIIAILLMLTIISIGYIQIIKYRRTKIIAKNNQKIIELELEKERNDKLLLEKQFKEKEILTLLEEEKLKNEIEAKNRKLAAKALHLTSRNELIEQILNSLSNIPEISKNAVIVNQVRQLEHNLKETDTEWQNFLTHFEEVNHGFISTLKSKHSNLSANDIRFLSYVYMNLNSKEISSLLNITPEACRKRKERICAKMNLSENVNIYDYLSKMQS
jgi:tetratricopeptide (TPR) repeat protein